jgi:hypothetical protein
MTQDMPEEREIAASNPELSPKIYIRMLNNETPMNVVPADR